MHKVMHKNKIYKLSHGTNAHKKNNEPQNGPKTNNCILFCCSPDIAIFFGRVDVYKRQRFERGPGEGCRGHSAEDPRQIHQED